MQGMNLGKILTASALGLGLLFTPVKKSDALDFYLYGGARTNFKLETAYRASIEGTPEYIRNVPAHPDDLWKVNPEDVAPIADSGFSFPVSMDNVSLELNVGVGIREGIFDFSVGPRLAFSNLNSFGFPKKERNYTNSPGTEERGYGAALTYCGFNFENNSPIDIGLSSRASLNFDLSEGYNAMTLGPYVEYSFMFFPGNHFFVETGWDRYNSLETKDKYEIASGLINHSVEVGLNFSIKPFSVELYSAMDISQIASTTSLARDTGFSFNPSTAFSAGIRTRVHLDSLMFKVLFD